MVLNAHLNAISTWKTLRKIRYKGNLAVTQTQVNLHHRVKPLWPLDVSVQQGITSYSETGVKGKKQEPNECFHVCKNDAAHML